MPVDNTTAAAESADALASLKMHFLASLNHEVRTPLTGIMGMTDLLRETRLDEEQRGYVAAVRSCADDLLALFNKTLEYSELATGRVVLTKREFHLPESVRGVVSAHSASARAKGLLLVCRLAPTVPELAIGDAERLQHILDHLVDNAIKFTERGKVEVNVTGEAIAGKLQLKLRVQDTGIGIPADKLPAIFESFQQLDSGLARSYDGLGLGLSLVKELIALMGGNVSVTSDPGHGSLFTVIVPLDLAPEPASSAMHESPHSVAMAAKRRRVLLVEDNQVARTVVTHLLNRAGYLVRCASNGTEAVDAASRHAYDVVLMDLQLPGMDGFDTTRRIRELPGRASTAVVALTANSADSFRQQCLSNGMQGFVPKPVRARALLEAVAAAVPQ